MKKIKYVLKAAIILGIVFAFVVPATAMTEKAQPEITRITPYNKLFKMLNLNPGWAEQASGFWEPSRGINYMHAVDENVVWAVGYDGSGSQLNVQEFTKTTDGGDLWVADLIDTAPSDGDSAMICALDDMYAWVPIYTASGTNQGIWKTSDGGSTWAQQTTADFTGGFPNCVHFWDENNGWCMGDPVGGYFEIYTTTDGGDNWVRVPQGNIPAPSSSAEYGVVGYYDVVGDTVWFGTQDANYGGRVFKSTDKGLTWTVSAVIFAPGSYVDIRFRDDLHGLAMDKNFAAAELAETSDGGATWTTIVYTGKCQAADFDYVPGTPDMYVSTGVQTGVPDYNGATYSLDGGHSWTTWAEVDGIQLFGTSWVAGRIGWAGNFNVDQYNGGVYKYTPPANEPPSAPIIDGPVKAKANTAIPYNFTSSDPDLDDIKEYNINWGDGTAEETVTGPFASGETITASHTWAKKGTYVISAKATDINDNIGPTGSKSIEIPRTKIVYTPFLNFLQDHPNLSMILRLVFQQFGL
jgi:photosystem II stability/assembly factor-like uncharacterized protein